MKSSSRIFAEGERYTIDNDQFIGRGSYSEVYKGRTASGRLVAVKTACKRVEIQAMRVEIEVLQKLKDAPNIVQLIGFCNEKMPPGSVPAETFSFAMEYAKSSLDAEMRRPENQKGLPADMYIDLVIDCSSALSSLQGLNIAHRDIKHMNILVFPGSPTRGRRSAHLFKLCDMGCSKALLEESSQEMCTLVGTPNLLHPYLAREMIDTRMAQNRHDWKTKQTYTPEQCDLWALGCTLYYCATGKLPFDSEKRNPKLYCEAVVALTQKPDAIGMIPVMKERNAGNQEADYEFEPITEVPNKHNRYPMWLIRTTTCIIRQFFHDPSVTKYAEIANAMRTAKRRTFLSIDQLSVIDHTDMSDVPYVGFSIPSLSVCMGYPEGTDLQLISSTSSQFFDSKRKHLNGLHDDYYLVFPMTSVVGVRKIFARNIEYRELEDMTDLKLTEVRYKKCYDGFSMLAECDEYVQLFDSVSKILSTQFLLLADEFTHFERIQTTSRFAVYMDMACIPIILFDSVNSDAKNITEVCIQKATQTREELERHMKNAMSFEGAAKQFAEDASNLRLDDVDLPGMRDELESYNFPNDKNKILGTRQYSQILVEKCFKRRQCILKQMFKSPDGKKESKLKQALNLAASLLKSRDEYRKLQITITECIDLLEKPFQEMKQVVNKHLQEQGHSRKSMNQSMHFLAPEFREDQKKVKATSRINKELVDQLNQELETLKQMGFVRIGDTILREESEDRTLVNQNTTVSDTANEMMESTAPGSSSDKSSRPLEPQAEPTTANTTVETTTSEESETSVLTYSSSEVSTTSFESTPPTSPQQNEPNLLQAFVQFLTKPMS